MEIGISRPPWTSGEFFTFLDNTTAVILARFLIVNQIEQIRLRGMCPTIDGDKAPSNFTLAAIVKRS